MSNTYKMLGLSTAHLTNETCKKIDEYCDICVRNQKHEDGYNETDIDIIAYSKGEYGWFVLVCGWDDDPDANIPEDLKDCLEFASRHGYDWIMFDPEEDEVGELSTYHWSC